MSCILVVDIGSSSTRCVAYDLEARMLEGSLFQDKSLGLTAEATMDSNEVVGKTEGVIAQCIEWCREHGWAKIQGLGIDSFALSFLGINGSGEACTPCFTYADARPDEFAQQLREKLGANGQEEAYERTGTVIHSSYAPAHYLRICAQEGNVAAGVAQWRTLGAHIIARLSGRGLRTPIGYSEASWTGMLNRHTLQWDATLCAAVGLPLSQLPPLADFDDVLPFADSWREQFPELSEAGIFMALGDGAAANVGSGAIDSRFVCVTVGTSAAMRCVIQSSTPPQLPPGLWNYRISRDRHLIGGALTDAGSLYQWYSSTLAGGGSDELWDKVENLAPDAHGLTVLPFLSGERATGWRGDATLTMHGITRATEPQHMIRAGMEAVVLRLGEIMKRLEGLVDSDSKLVAAGGPLENVPLWGRMISDVTGKTVQLMDALEVTSRGVAVLMCESINGHPPPPAGVKDEILPNADANAAYTAALSRNNALYNDIYPTKTTATAKL